MKEIFESILSASLSGSVIILLVLILRLLLKKAPRRYICLLWLLAGVRLLIPLNIESSFSLQPDLDRITSQVSTVLHDVTPDLSVTPEQTPAVPDNVAPPADATVITPNAGTITPPTEVDTPVPNGDSTVIYDNNAVTEPVIIITDYGTIAAGVWITVACCIALYTLVSFLRLKRKIADAVQVDEGIYEHAGVESPFLLGYVRPNIYLPTGIHLDDLDYILAHERAHIERGDNWVKLIGFLCVGLHWFNPLVWLAYALLCKDIEMACDEYVVKYMSVDDRKAYSNALVSCAAQHRVFSACPVTFGEVSVKQRVLTVLNYRKPGFWISLVSVIAIVFVAVCFLTNPITADKHDIPTVTTPTGAMPDDPTVTEEAYLAQCREALESWQNLSSYHLVNTMQFDGELVLETSAQTESWRDGANWVYVRSSQEMNNGSEIWRIFNDGICYWRSISGLNEGKSYYDTGWEQVDSHNNEALYDWVMDLDLDACTVTFQENRADESGYTIVLLVSGPNLAIYPDAEEMFVSFHFSDANELYAVSREFTTSRTVNVDELDMTHSIQTTRLISGNSVEITATIDFHYLEAQLETSMDEAAKALSD